MSGRGSAAESLVPPTLIDLTRPINGDSEIFHDGAYSDPPLRIETWCEIDSQGFWVSKLEMGTQTGTHIDAPAHFLPGGPTLEAVKLADLVGRYFFVTIDEYVAVPDREAMRAEYDGQAVLFLNANTNKTKVRIDAIHELLSLECRVWVVASDIEIDHADAYRFHQLLAEHGVFLIEDLDREAARQVRSGGVIYALPLRLEGVSGAPCRVVIQQNA